MAATSINCLAVVLKELGWSYTRLIAELRRQAAVDGIVLPKTESLIPIISRWVNNHQQPDDFYHQLLSRATGRQRFELFSDEAAVALLAARTNAGIAPIVTVGSDEDMNRRQLLARSAALAAALAADPLVSMPGMGMGAEDGLIQAQAVPVGEAEQEIVASIRRVMLGLGSPPAYSLLSGDPDVRVLDRRVNEAWKRRGRFRPQDPHGRAIAACNSWYSSCTLCSDLLAAPLRCVGVRPRNRSPSMGLLRRPTPGEIVEGGRFSRPCGPGALSRASQKTQLAASPPFTFPATPIDTHRSAASRTR